MLHVEGLDENNMSKMTSRSAATMHDQQNHLIQRTCAREAIGHSPKIVQWDEGSKRGKAWVAARDGGKPRERRRHCATKKTQKCDPCVCQPATPVSLYPLMCLNGTPHVRDAVQSDIP